MNARAPLIFGVVALLLFSIPGTSPAQSNLVASDLSEQIKVVDVAFDRHSVSGRLVNRTRHTVRDVRLEVRLTWYWKNEKSPGEESPGRTGFYGVPGEIGPDGDVRFTYTLDPPLPDRPDGEFAAFVNVAGFTEVVAE